MFTSQQRYKCLDKNGKFSLVWITTYFIKGLCGIECFRLPANEHVSWKRKLNERTLSTAYNHHVSFVEELEKGSFKVYHQNQRFATIEIYTFFKSQSNGTLSD